MPVLRGRWPRKDRLATSRRRPVACVRPVRVCVEAMLPGGTTASFSSDTAWNTMSDMSGIEGRRIASLQDFNCVVAGYPGLRPGLSYLAPLGPEPSAS